MHRLWRLEDGLGDHYLFERLSMNFRLQAFVWRVHVTIPVYGDRQVLRIELDERRAVRVTAEGWTGPMRHTFGANTLCMWYPKDPLDRQWNREDGLLKLVDTAAAHLFKEMYFRETRRASAAGRWAPSVDWLAPTALDVIRLIIVTVASATFILVMLATVRFFLAQPISSIPRLIGILIAAPLLRSVVRGEGAQTGIDRSGRAGSLCEHLA